MATPTFYADVYNDAAEAGVRILDSLRDSVQLIQRVNLYSMSVVGELYKALDAVRARNDLATEIKFTLNKVNVDAYEIEAYKYAFTGLFKWVDEVYGMTMDEYLTANGLTVLPTFAEIAATFGQTISAANIRQE